MNAIAFPLQRPPATGAPAWVALPMLAVGATMGAAAWAGGQWPLTVVVLLLVAVSFILVVSRPHLGISVFLTTFLINYPAVARGAGYLTINNVLGALLLGLLAWDYYVRRDAWYLRAPLVRLLLVIGAVMLIGTLVAEYRLPDSYIRGLLVRRIGAIRVGVDYSERQLFQYFSRVAFVIFVLQFVRTPRQLRSVFQTLLACILAAVPSALYQYTQAGAAEDIRIYSPIVNWADNVNRFAFGCLIGIVLLHHVFIVARSTVVRIIAAVGATLLLPLVLLSASRSGFLGLCFLGLLIVFGAFGIQEHRRSRAAVLGAVAMMAGLAVLTFFFALGPKLQERVLNLNPFASEHLEGAVSAQQRAESMQESLALVRMYPVFGVGIGNFRWVNRYHHQSRWKPPHNSYLWAAAEGGIVLLVLYLTLFWKLWRQLGRLRPIYAARLDLPLFPHWLRVYMLMFLFFSLFADVWLDVHVFLLIAAAVLLDHWQQTPPDGPVASPPEGPRPSCGGNAGVSVTASGPQPGPLAMGVT